MIAGALLALVLASPAEALPRFAARTGATCDACHVNPTGGGMRTEYGSDVYARTALPLWSEATAALPTRWSPADNQRVGVGADLRAGFVGLDTRVVFDPMGQEPYQIPELVSLFLMQADVYAAVEPNRYLLLYADYGLISNAVEIFGLLRPQVAGSYLKVGAFVPPYGLKLANHRTFIREEGLGIDANFREAGLEVGAHPGPHRVAVALFNGGGGAAGLNPDYRVALSGIADVTLQTSGVVATLGGSWWWQPGGEQTAEADERTLDLRAGAYWTLSAWRLTLLGETDYRSTRDAATGEHEQLLAAYHELAVLPVQGLDLVFLYEFLDPDITLSPNALHRVGGGFELFPVPHAELKVQVRHVLARAESLDDPRTFYSTGAVRGMTDVAVFLHLFL